MSYESKDIKCCTKLAKIWKTLKCIGSISQGEDLLPPTFSSSDSDEMNYYSFKDDFTQYAALKSLTLDKQLED